MATIIIAKPILDKAIFSLWFRLLQRLGEL
jgi:hypothetical protein